MINFHIGLSNPWAQDEFKNIYCKSKQISTNKVIEVECIKWSCLVTLTVNISWRGSDHAGPSIELGLLGYEVHIKIYDTRHWNYENNNWEVYEE